MYEDSVDIKGGDLTWPPPKSPPEEMRKGDKSHLPNGDWRVGGTVGASFGKYRNEYPSGQRDR